MTPEPTRHRNGHGTARSSPMSLSTGDGGSPWWRLKKAIATLPRMTPHDPERLRLAEHDAGRVNWKRWGTYVSERAWGTVREDYSANGDAWNYFPHDHARSRAYRWNEDGLGGFCDERQRICLAVALWNERDPFLKERMFGLSNSQGNHGEDVKEYYFFLDGTPTHSYMKMVYKYPQVAFPYDDLVAVNGAREPEASRSTSCSTPCATPSWPIATSTSSSSTPRRTPRTCSAGSPRSTAGRRRRRSASCRTSGTATSGRGPPVSSGRSSGPSAPAR